MFHTFSRNYTVANISAGKYSNIRLMAGNSQGAAAYPWMTAAQSIADGNMTVPDYSLFQFSGACWWVPHPIVTQQPLLDPPCIVAWSLPYGCTVL
jgi:hypothetical protein